MLNEACFVWNHALALQKRYYKIYGKYISKYRMQGHFRKRISRNLLHSQTVEEILERQNIAYQRFFNRIARRSPKFKKSQDFSSIVFRQGGYSLNGNVLTINRINKRFKFSKSRTYEGTIKRLILKRSHLREYYIVMLIDKPVQKIRKTHNGASVGIDFGLKKYMTLSDGLIVDNPQFLKVGLKSLHRKSRNLSKCVHGSRNYDRKRLDIDRFYEKVVNQRNDFQWKLAHHLCQQYDRIFIEDLNLSGMAKLWGRKMSDLAHGEFLFKLQYVATKYDVQIHKINRFYPSSRICTCGYLNSNLQVRERTWICPECGTFHKRDLLAANNILRQGIVELESDSKTKSAFGASSQSRQDPRIS